MALLHRPILLLIDSHLYKTIAERHKIWSYSGIWVMHTCKVGCTWSHDIIGTLEVVCAHAAPPAGRKQNTILALKSLHFIRWKLQVRLERDLRLVIDIWISEEGLLIYFQVLSKFSWTNKLITASFFLFLFIWSIKLSLLTLRTVVPD